MWILTINWEPPIFAITISHWNNSKGCRQVWDEQRSSTEYLNYYHNQWYLLQMLHVGIQPEKYEILDENWTLGVDAFITNQFW